MQTRSTFNVIGPGGTAYFFRRTCSLPDEGVAAPARVASGVAPDPARGETGYIMRKGQRIWGQALFDPACNRWRFLKQPVFAGVAAAGPMQARWADNSQAAEPGE